nr:helix-turn-helix transcriptional regulator [Paenibacillus xylanexedens]
MKGADGISIAQKLTLKEARENFGYSLEDVARKTGIEASRINELEIDASHAAVDEFVSLCQCYGTNCNHVYSGVASDVQNARMSKRLTDFNDVSTLNFIKWQLAELYRCVDDDEMFTREEISKSLRGIFHEVHNLEALVLTPFMKDQDNVVGGRAV